MGLSTVAVVMRVWLHIQKAWDLLWFCYMAKLGCNIGQLFIAHLCLAGHKFSKAVSALGLASCVPEIVALLPMGHICALREPG